MMPKTRLLVRVIGTSEVLEVMQLKVAVSLFVVLKTQRA